MLMLCDVNEYRKCVNQWKASSAKRLFEALHALANLLVVLPENLPEAASSIELVSIFNLYSRNYCSARRRAIINF